MKRITDKERLEEIFARVELADAFHLLDLARLIVRLRFPSKDAPAKRGRKPRTQTALPIALEASR